MWIEKCGWKNADGKELIEVTCFCLFVVVIFMFFLF